MSRVLAHVLASLAYIGNVELTALESLQELARLFLMLDPSIASSKYTSIRFAQRLAKMETAPFDKASMSKLSKSRLRLKGYSEDAVVAKSEKVWLRKEGKLEMWLKQKRELEMSLKSPTAKGKSREKDRKKLMRINEFLNSKKRRKSIDNKKSQALQQELPSDRRALLAEKAWSSIETRAGLLNDGVVPFGRSLQGELSPLIIRSDGSTSKYSSGWAAICGAVRDDVLKPLDDVFAVKRGRGLGSPEFRSLKGKDNIAEWNGMNAAVDLAELAVDAGIDDIQLQFDCLRLGDRDTDVRTRLERLQQRARVTLVWIPRELNHEADDMARQAGRKATGKIVNDKIDSTIWKQRWQKSR